MSGSLLWVMMLLGCESPVADPAPGGDAGGDAATTDSGAVEQAPFESAIRCAECHPRQYADWQQSMHAYAARSPVFDAMAAKAYRDSSGEIGSFCTSCHSPFGEAQGLSGATVAADRDAMALQGVSCDYCHTAVDHDAFIGNNQLINDPGGAKQGPFASTAMDGHASEQSDFTTTPELCGSCHDVYKYPGLQIEQAYTEHLESPAYAEGLRCQDCHMSPEPGVPGGRTVGPSAVVAGQSYPDREQASHRFVGPDYSLIDDFPYPDDLAASAVAQAEYLGLVQQLLENSVHIAGAEGNREGGKLLLDIQLESLTNGHRVPTGFTSERQLWIELTVTDGDGQTFFSSGDLDADGNLRDLHSGQVQAGQALLDDALVNLQSKNMVRVRDIGANGGSTLDESLRDEFETIFPFDADYIERHSLLPLETRSYGYEIDELGRPPPYTVDVKLHYRNLPPYVLQALQLDALIDRLQIFTLDSTGLIVE